MLVVGRIERAGRHHHHAWLARGGLRRHGTQRRQQLVGVMIDRLDAQAAEKLGEKPQHRLAVLHHVGDAGRGAGVVFQHVELVRPRAYEVDTGDMRIEPGGGLDSCHFRPERRVREDEILRHDAGLHDVAVAVDIPDEGVQRLDALLEPLSEPVPFTVGEDARQDVEGDDAFRALFVAVNRESDADPPEKGLGLGLAVPDQFGARLFEPGRNLAVDGAWISVHPASFVEHNPLTHDTSPRKRQP